MKPRPAIDGRAIRLFVRGRGCGALATCDAKHGGAPYNSFVTYACDLDGSPLFLFSTLSDHTRNLDADARASLLVEATSGRRNPQTGPRVTLTGTVERVKPRARSQARDRFLARHPDAALYADFGDFAFFRMTIDRAHWVGGFAQARWMDAKKVVLADRKALKAVGEAAPGAVEHMNADHADAVDLYAGRLLERKGKGWQITGIDPDGVDLRLKGRVARLDFAGPIDGPGALRAELADLAKRARG